MADGRKGTSNKQKAGNVGESFHVSCGWVDTGLGAAPAGRVGGQDSRMLTSGQGL